MRPIKQDALSNDTRLLEMSIYQETKGQTRHCTQDAIIARLKEYKTLIKRGEATIDSLEDQVFSRFGVLKETSVRDTKLLDSEQLPQSDFGSFFRDMLRTSQGLSNGQQSLPDRPPEDFQMPEDLLKEMLDQDFPEGDEDDDEQDFQNHE